MPAVSSGVGVDVDTWYRYPLWETVNQRATCPHPRADATDYTVTYLHVRLSSAVDVSVASRHLDTIDAGWRDALWALVGLKDDIARPSARSANLADSSREPLWAEWDADAMGYSPGVYGSPRAAMMGRVLNLVEEFKDEIPETFEGYDVRAHVVDVILGDGMQYEIYGFTEDPMVAAFFAPLDAAADAITDAVNEISVWLAVFWVAIESLYLTYLAQVTVFNDVVGNMMLDIMAEVQGTSDDPDFDRVVIQVGLVIQEVTLLALLLGPLLIMLTSLAPQLFMAAALTVVAALSAITTLLNVISAALPNLKSTLSDANAEQYIVEHYVRPSRVAGATAQRFSPEPEIDTVLVVPLRFGEDPRREYDMTRVEFPVTFEGHTGTIASAANHGFLPSEVDPDLPFGSRVWFGAPKLEWCSVVYDWFVGMAIRHYAASFTAATDQEAQDQITAAGLCLRMALTGCAYFGQYVLHETTHNLNLWHCRAPDSDMWGFAQRNRAAGCAQDAIGVLFRAHLTARLGLPQGGWHDPVGEANTGHFDVAWKLRDSSGRRCATAGTPIVPSAGLGGGISCCASVTTPVQPFNDDIECLALESGAAGLGALADTVMAAAVAVVIWDALDPTVSFSNTASSEAVQSADLFGELRKDEQILRGHVLGTGQDYFYATLTYNIDRPLNLGGSITWCCAVGRSVCADTIGPVPCWSTNPPKGYRGCECNGEDLEAGC